MIERDEIEKKCKELGWPKVEKSSGQCFETEKTKAEGRRAKEIETVQKVIRKTHGREVVYHFTVSNGDKD